MRIIQCLAFNLAKIEAYLSKLTKSMANLQASMVVFKANQGLRTT